ncbi:hypothetical protein CVT24_007960 [Panaeolus cyanescens]|uniref:DUF6533 domain-containing protein n=1 Tax=Panaeolus cyanescens TaxID=181874 RepID=A0A409W529_9AGAR|nr:hypothetical protein CVT24_007960 [Panaeolus cyanescens]
MLPSLSIRAPSIDGNTSSSGSQDTIESFQLVHYCQVAALVITLYDHIITLDREVEYIWMRKWSKSKVLYLLARYFGDFLLISVIVVFLNQDASRLDNTNPVSYAALFCENKGLIGLKVVGTGSMVIILITQVIMQLRIKALYGKIISRIITVLWLIEVVGVLSLGVASLVAIDVRSYTLDTARVCNPTYLPRFAFLFWVPVICFETFLFVLAFRIAYLNWLEVGDWRGAALLHIVLRDNFQFFFLAFACYIVTAATWLTANPRYFTVPGSFSCSLTAIMGCRLVLNLCEAYHVPRGQQVTMARNNNSIWGATNTRTIRFINPKTTRQVECCTRTVDVIDGQITNVTTVSSSHPRTSEDEELAVAIRYEGADIKATLDSRADDLEGGPAYAMKTIITGAGSGDKTRSQTPTAFVRPHINLQVDDEHNHSNSTQPSTRPPRTQTDNDTV